MKNRISPVLIFSHLFRMLSARKLNRREIHVVMYSQISKSSLSEEFILFYCRIQLPTYLKLFVNLYIPFFGFYDFISPTLNELSINQY